MATNDTNKIHTPPGTHTPPDEVGGINNKNNIINNFKIKTTPPSSSTNDGQNVRCNTKIEKSNSNGDLPKKKGRKKKIETIDASPENFSKNSDGKFQDDMIVVTENGESNQELLKFLAENMDAVNAEICKRDLFELTKAFWPYISSEKPVYNWHMEYLCKELQAVGERLIKREKKESDIIINIPPVTSKSTIVSVMFPAWLWANDPSLKIISGSYAAALSTESSTKSRMIIISDLYQKYYPHVQIREDQNVKTNYQTSKGGARLTTSTGAMITGFHAHLILIDDPQNVELAHSEIERQKTNEWVSNTLSTRKTDSSLAVTIVVQQRLHAMDVTGHLLSKNKVYKHICLPGELNKSLQPKELADKYVDGLLDVNRLTREILDEKREDLGSKGYNAQILQNPHNEDDNIIKEKWLEVIPMSEFLARKGENNITIDFYLDSAYTKETKNDPSAILACTKIGELLYILNVSQVWMEFPKLINYIKGFVDANGGNHRSKVIVEPKASGKSIVQELKANSNLNIVEGPVPKGSKIERLNAISPKVEAGKVVLVQGNWNGKFIQEITMDEPDHDDMRDCFVMAIQDKLIRGRNYGKYHLAFVDWKGGK